jgi:very-short-patch-repair endonuclease
MQRDVDILRIAEPQAGAFSRAQAMNVVGFSASAVARRVRRGSWQPLHPGVFRATGAAPSWAQSCAAANLWGGTGAAVCGASAARLWGLDLPGNTRRDPTIHLAVPNPWWHGSALAGVEVFRRLNLTPSDIVWREGIRCTSLARTLVDLAERLSPMALEIALDSARRQHGGAAHQVLGLLARLGTRGRKGAGRLKRLALERLDFDQDSAIEVILLRALKNQRLEPSCNARVKCGDEMLEVDLLFEPQKVVIELQGYAFHSDRPQWEKDQARLRALQQAGYLVLPFTARDLKKPMACVRLIRQVLARR